LVRLPVAHTPYEERYNHALSPGSQTHVTLTWMNSKTLMKNITGLELFR